MKDLAAPHSTMTVYGENDEIIAVVPNSLLSYSYRGENGEWASATMLSDGLIHAVIGRPDEEEMYLVDPIGHHAEDLDEHTMGLLSREAPHGMVVTRTSDHIVPEEGKGATCGYVKDELQVDGSRLMVPGPKESVASHTRRLLAVERWTNCFPNEELKRLLSMGVALDVGFFRARAGGTLAGAQQAISSTFSDMNLVYVTQMNVQLQLAESIIKTSTGGDSWNEDKNAGGCKDINSKLEEFSSWSSGRAPHGLWHLYTDCYGPFGTVGLAWVGSICRPGVAAGVSSWTNSFWLVVAHEIGHNFGAGHSFELGQGSTGGIMDYGDGLLDGEFQFNTRYRKTEMCSQITTSLQRANRQTCWSFEPSDVDYKWIEGGFGPCDATCDGGKSTQTLTCVVDTVPEDLSPTPFSNCEDRNLPRPQTSQDCNTEPCDVQWTEGPLGQCNKPCGNGVATRSVTCQRIINGGLVTVADARCDNIAGGKPETDIACNTQACVDVNYFPSPWTQCTKPCGTGTQTRTVQCRDNGGNSVIEQQCIDKGLERPPEQQECNTDPCQNYRWLTEEFSECSRECGGGTRTRGVTCVGNDEQPVQDLFCTNQKPKRIEPCNEERCPQYRWKALPFNNCNVTCGGGFQYREVECHDFSTVPTTKLNNETDCVLRAGGRPGEENRCNQHPCPTYHWELGIFSVCDAVCGGGERSRTVECVIDGTLDSVVSDSFCSENAAGEPTPKPPVTVACNTPLCQPSQWVAGLYGGCSAGCGGGVRQRLVQCVNLQNQVLDDAECGSNAGIKPAETEPCNMAACPGRWVVGEWSACSKPCEGGDRTRFVDCVSVATGESTTGCPGPQPSAASTCNPQTCPQFAVQEWGACDAVCGEGFRRREIDCVDFKGNELPLQSCQGAPTTEEPCQDAPCPHWHRDAWGPCDKVCGTGQQERGLVCRLPHDGEFLGAEAPDDSLCPGETPDVTQPCGTDACPDLYWLLNWGSCSRECALPTAIGEQSASAICVNAAGQQQANSTVCGPQPPLTRACNTEACPVYEWHYAEENEEDEENRGFGECDRFCGGGYQYRDLRCLDVSTTFRWQVERENCERSAANRKPLERRRCNTARDICGVNGVCHRDGWCDCDPGYAGLTCDVVPNVRAVDTTARNYGGGGVPQGETVVVTWQTTGNISTVNIGLNRGVWRFPEYVAEGVPNTGRTLWTVDPTVEPGNDYSIEVFFTPEFRASSGGFAVADPCLYKNCGRFGQCLISDEGLPTCVCFAGWEGPTCAVSPCAQSHCSTANSNCTNLDGICDCFDGWVGSACTMPASEGCDTPSQLDYCRNGGIKTVVEGVEDGDACGVCQCFDNWGGDRCTKCQLNCKKGRPNADCSACECQYGWTGDNCDCRYIVGTATLSERGGTGVDMLWVDNTRETARYGRTIEKDVAGSIGVEADRVVAQWVRKSKGRSKTAVRFWLTEACTSTLADETNFFRGNAAQSPSLEATLEGAQRRLLQEDGTTADRTFFLTSVAQRFDEAEEECKLSSGHVASIRSEAENAIVRALVPPGEVVWIGLLDPSGDNNKYVWLDSTRFRLNDANFYQNWGPGQPNEPNQQYVVMDSNGDWYDEENLARKFVCVATTVNGEIVRPEPTLEDNTNILVERYRDRRSSLYRGLQTHKLVKLDIDNPHAKGSKVGLAIGLTFLFLFLFGVGGFVYYKKVHKGEDLFEENPLDTMRDKMSSLRGGPSVNSV